MPNLTEEQKEFILGHHQKALRYGNEITAEYIEELFPEAFDKPERVKKVFEVESDDIDQKNILQSPIDAKMIRTGLNNLCDSKDRNIIVTEVTDKPTNPTPDNTAFDSGYDKKQQDAMNFKLPEREGMNVRIEWDTIEDEDAYIASILLIECVEKAVNKTFSSFIRHFSVKEIGAGKPNDELLKDFFNYINPYPATSTFEKTLVGFMVYLEEKNK